MTWSILCNLFFLYNKKRHGRILFFHTYYLLLYSTRYTFFSIICVSCTYFPLRVNWIHSIHAYHLYLILHPEQEAWHQSWWLSALLTLLSFLWKTLSVSYPWGWKTGCTASQTSPGQISHKSMSEYAQSVSRSDNWKNRCQKVSRLYPLSLFGKSAPYPY